MSMTLEEAIAVLEESKRQNEIMRDNPTTFWASHQMADGVKNAKRRIEALAHVLSALRPVSRERVDKVWRGEWMALDECSNEGVYCKRCKKKVYRIEYANEKMRSPFCPACGAAQTDEAVEITMRRLEELHNA
jgi:hypothetical protein